MEVVGRLGTEWWGGGVVGRWLRKAQLPCRADQLTPETPLWLACVWGVCVCLQIRVAKATMKRYKPGTTREFGAASRCMPARRCCWHAVVVVGTPLLLLLLGPWMDLPSLGHGQTLLSGPS